MPRKPKNEEPITLTQEQVAEVAFMAAGAASVPFMEDYPDYVMPTERICEGVDRVLLDHGVDVANLHGYSGARR